MAMLARIVVDEASADRRRANRRLLKLEVPGVVRDSSGTSVVVHDLSRGGLLIETSLGLAPGERLTVELPEAGATNAIVMWNDAGYFGCRFEAPISPAALSAAQLMNPAAHRTESGVCGRGSGEAIERLPPITRVAVVGALALASWALVLIPLSAAAFLS